MYAVYLFQEKKTGNIIYVGSTSRWSARMKEHQRALRDGKGSGAIHKYMNANNLRLVDDVRILWEATADNAEDMLKLEEKYYYKYLPQGHLLNERPANDMRGGNNPKRRKTKCLNDGKLFETISEAARFYGIPRTSVDAVVHGRRSYTTHNGIKYIFKQEHVTTIE